MKCVHYSVYSKKTGNLVYRTFGWIDKRTDVYKWVKENFNERTVKVVVEKVSE